MSRISPKVLVLSASLNPGSRSRSMSLELFKQLPEEVEKEFLDLRDYELPMCDGDVCYNQPLVHQLQGVIRDSHCILIGFPVYNFSYSAALKNVIELTGKAWEGKIVGFVCAAGGRSSYMSAMTLANSLMLDFRSIIIPRFVYTDGSSFKDEELADPAISERLLDLGITAVRMTEALLGIPV